MRVSLALVVLAALTLTGLSVVYAQDVEGDPEEIVPATTVAAPSTSVVPSPPPATRVSAGTEPTAQAPAAATIAATHSAYRAPPVPLFRAPATAPGMVFVHGSTFTLGAGMPPAGPDHGETTRVDLDGGTVPPPQLRREVVAGFLLDATEVTVAAYRDCVLQKKCEVPRQSSASCTYTAGVANYPINCVSFEQAQTYCRAQLKRLPREAEWELAARGNRPGFYPWGALAVGCHNANTLRSEVSGRSCSANYPLVVGSLPMNVSVSGARDLAGNVEEWVQDFYSEDVRHGAPRAGTSHVLRGGSWLLPPSSAKNTARNYASAMEAGPGVGFRCAKDAPSRQ
jgi:formylglycine-generating enzyme required for sulfatase activity